MKERKKEKRGFLIGNFRLWGGWVSFFFSLFFCWLFLWMGTEGEEEVVVLKLEKDGRDSRGQEGYRCIQQDCTSWSSYIHENSYRWKQINLCTFLSALTVSSWAPSPTQKRERDLETTKTWEEQEEDRLPWS